MLKFKHGSAAPNTTGKRRVSTLLGLALGSLLIFSPAVITAQQPVVTQEAVEPALPPTPEAEPAALTADQQAIADLQNYITNAGGVSEGSPLEGSPGPGHNAWLMTSAALVLLMTLPGLALFYGGLVRQKNVLSVLAQCLGCAGLVTVLWFFCGYSLVFGESFGSTFYGGTEFFMFNGVTGAPNTTYLPWISQNVFAMFQLMFAIITPALIVGAIAERMKFSALMLFVGAWFFVVYIPMAHMTWGSTGFMNGAWSSLAGIRSIDFAGGTVVHMASGWSALVLCLILGPRAGFGKQPMPPHSMVLCMTGTGLLWFGWYGFNAGSAGAADALAGQAFTTTTICAATACLTWGIIEKLIRKHASVLGFCSGAVSGLVVITPAAGFVTATSAFIMGIIAAIVCYLGCTMVKKAFKYDDSLDTFGIHGIGGTFGALLTGIFADPEINGVLKFDNFLHKVLWVEQLKSIALTITLSVVATVILAYAIKATIGLRPAAEDEETGLDITDHGEEGYAMD